MIRENFSWLRDYEVIKTSGLPEYLVKPASYCDDFIYSPTNLFLAIYDNTDETFIGTIKAEHINWYSSTADIGIMIGDRTRWGKGLAIDGISVLFQYLFDSTKLRRLTVGAVVQAGVEVGVNTVLNTGCRVDHDCSIGSHSFISSGAVMCGGGNVGAGAVVIENITIGKNITVGAGASVARNIDNRVIVSGVPARKHKFNKEC